jgi:AcrR family transcriptional regulator
MKAQTARRLKPTRAPAAQRTAVGRKAAPHPSVAHPASPGAAPRGEPRANNRLGALLDAAAELFASRGFRGTTMRDIAARTAMLPGSIYYHFPSKEHLLVAVYEEGVRRLRARVDRADPGPAAEPWGRLEAILAAHLETILERSHYAQVMIRVLPDAAPAVAQRLVELRDRYDGFVAEVVATLPLPPEVDRALYRFFLLGALNHVQVWRREGPRTPTQIAAALARVFRVQGAP